MKFPVGSWMKKCLFIFYAHALFFTSCAGTPSKEDVEYVRTKPIHKGIDREFRTFVRKFQDKTDRSYNIYNLTIGFKAKPYPIVGQCYWLNIFQREIDIDPWHWQTISEREKEALIDHELGHCVCHRLHRLNYDRKWYDKLAEFIGIARKEGTLYDGCPDSVMHYGYIPQSCLIKHKDFYDTEMKYFCN